MNEKRIKIKCDLCSHNVLSDETSVGLGWIPYCNEGHWGGGCEQYDNNEEYCSYRDTCKDFDNIKND